MRTNNRHHTAFAVASLAADAVMIIALMPSAGAHADNGSLPEVPVLPVLRYGAIAYAPSGAHGKSWRYSTRADAQNAALNMCGVPSCKVLSSFARCGAVAYDGSAYHGGTGRTRRMAEEDATDRLGGGSIVASVCN